MAIVQTMTSKWGGVIQVADDAYRGHSAREIEERRAATRRVAGQIAYNIARAAAMEREDNIRELRD